MEHRLVDKIVEDEVRIVACRYHYVRLTARMSPCTDVQPAACQASISA
jgi:YoeB-like toxin of bacterial type II toxin-antitoxin system